MRLYSKTHGGDALKVIAILNQKGGSGKTTLSVHLARAIQLSGDSVLLVDSDPQGSARDWSEENEGELLPVVGLDRETIGAELKRIGTGFDWVVIDGAPQVAKLMASAVKVADVVVIPVQPSALDVWAVSDLLEAIEARQELTDKPRAAFVINRAIKGTKLSGEVVKALDESSVPVLETQITQRVIFPTVMGEGSTVLDASDNPAADEVRALLDEVKALANVVEGVA